MSSSSSRNRLNKKNPKQLVSTSKPTQNSSNKRASLVLSDLCISSPSSTHCKTLTTMTDTEIGYSKVSYGQGKRFSICTSDNLELKDRRDAHGNPIFKGNKSHKVTFIDDVCRKNIAEVIIVDSENSMRNNLNDKDKTTCQCEAGCSIY